MNQFFLSPNHFVQHVGECIIAPSIKMLDVFGFSIGASRIDFETLELIFHFLLDSYSKLILYSKLTLISTENLLILGFYTLNFCENYF